MLGFDYWISGSGGTGFVAPNTGLGRVKYQDRIQHDVIGYAPDVVVIQGGQNDTIYTKASVQAAAELLFNTLRTALPNTPIITIGPIAIGAMTTAVTDTRDAIKTAALANGVAMIDSVDGVTYDFKGNALAPAMGNWLNGTGNISAPTTTGNRSIYTWTDNGHPSNAGHLYIGERVAGEVYQLLNLF
jgi:lysophospholipase L1-like esterase